MRERGRRQDIFDTSSGENVDAYSFIKDTFYIREATNIFNVKLDGKNL
jgi:hypothetical protein